MPETGDCYLIYSFAQSIPKFTNWLINCFKTAFFLLVVLTTLVVLMTWHPGWWPTGYKSTLPRRRYCDGPQLVVSIRSQVIQYVLATHPCCQCPSSLSLTLTWVWEPTSLQPSGPVLRRCDRSVVCAVHWRRMLCWLCSAHWSSPSLTSWLLLFNVGWCVWNTDAEILQSMLNATAWLVYSARRSEHTTPFLRQLHWLKVPERIKFRLCVLVHRCLHNKAPPYLAETLHLTTEIDARRRLLSANTYCAVNPPVHDRRPSLSSGSGVCLELSVIERQDCLVFERVSGRPQNSSAQGIVWWPDMMLPFSLTTDTRDL